MESQKKTAGGKPGYNFGEIPERNPSAIHEAIPAGNPQYKSQHIFLEQFQQVSR